MEAVCKAVDGPVSLEVVGTTAESMVEEARNLVTFGPNVVVKIPLIAEGLKAVRQLTAMGISTNVTLAFSAVQALLAAKAGATYVSPFVGRLDGIGQDGMEIISQIRTIYDNYDIETKILTASVRHPGHVLEAAMIGSDAITIPFNVIEQLAKHPLTDLGLESFLKDWKKLTA